MGLLEKTEGKEFAIAKLVLLIAFIYLLYKLLDKFGLIGMSEDEKNANKLSESEAINDSVEKNSPLGKAVSKALNKPTTKRYVLKNTPAPAQKTKPLPKAPAPSLRNIERTICPEYTPTRIWQTRHSEFWQWQRVSEWHREYGQDEITNEKRHILV